MINFIQYLYGSNKGSTTAGTMFNSALNMGASDKNYTSEDADGEVLGTELKTAYTGNLSWKPVTPKSVTITAGAVTITDDGNGALKAATGLSANGTIDYATGAFSFTLSAAATEDPVASYKYNNEFVPGNIPEITLKLQSLPVVAHTRRLKALYGFEAAFELQKEYGEDMDKLLAAQASAEIAHEIDIELTGDLYSQAAAGAEVTWSQSAPVGVSQADHFLSFQTALTRGSNEIFAATRRVRANFVVVGLNVATIIESMRTFQPSGVTEMNGPYFAGTLGNLKVYVSPDFEADVFVEGYKGDDLLQAGYVYAPLTLAA